MKRHYAALRGLFSPYDFSMPVSLFRFSFSPMIAAFIILFDDFLSFGDVFIFIFFSFFSMPLRVVHGALFRRQRLILRCLLERRLRADLSIS